MGWQRNDHSSYPPPPPPPSPLSVSVSKDYYKVLDVSYDASDETIRTSYLRLALKWHPDKHKGEEYATVKFQEINEAYRVLSDAVKRQDYDTSTYIDVQHYSIMEYLNRFQGLILTCNGLGIVNLPQWQWDINFCN